MPWPGITDFSEAVQNPLLCFAGTDLENGLIATNPRGMPLVYSGAFACVYPVSIGGRTYAVRCFTREVSDQQHRYNALSDYLLNVLPPAFVHFEYVEDGISVRGTSYPLVKMEWVEGELLSSYVEAHLNDSDALRRIAAQWRGGTTASLRGLRIAHNDLQHGNVMVQNDGNIRLVDYDGMFLPQFAGEKSPELGHKNYQHPERTSDDYADYVDNFPALVIYLSLLAIAAEPQLWEFNNEDNLILARTDYADPASSEVFKRLKSSSDSSVVELTEKLIECCGLAVADVPDLETALQGIRVTAPAPPSSPPPTPTRTPTPIPTQSTAMPPAAPSASQLQVAQAQQSSLTPPPPKPITRLPATSVTPTLGNLPTMPTYPTAPPVAHQPFPPPAPPATTFGTLRQQIAASPSTHMKATSCSEISFGFKASVVLIAMALLIAITSPLWSFFYGQAVTSLKTSGIIGEQVYISTGVGDVFNFAFSMVGFAILVAIATAVVNLIRNAMSGQLGNADIWAVGAFALGVVVFGAGLALGLFANAAAVRSVNQLQIASIVLSAGKTILFAAITAMALAGPRRRRFFIGWTAAIGWGALGVGWINLLSAGLLWLGIFAATMSDDWARLRGIGDDPSRLRNRLDSSRFRVPLLRPQERVRAGLR